MSRRDTTDSILQAFRTDLVSLRRRVTEQAAELGLLREEIARLQRENEALRRREDAAPVDLAEMDAKLAALEAELARRKTAGKNSSNSSNSSKPPSTDHPHDPKSERD